MKRLNIITLLLCTLAALLIPTSCHLSGTSYDADKAKGYEEAFKLIQKNLDPDEKLYSLQFQTSQTQGNKLETVVIKYVNTNNKAYSQKIQLMGAQVVSDPEGIPATFESPVYKDVKGIDLSRIDPKKIEAQIDQAKAQIPKKAKFSSIYSYTITEVVPAGSSSLEADDSEIGKQKTFFMLTFTQKNSDGSEGITEVRVNVDDKGQAKFDIE